MQPQWELGRTPNSLHEHTLTDFQNITEMEIGLQYKQAVNKISKTVLLCCAILELFSEICHIAYSPVFSFVHIFIF